MSSVEILVGVEVKDQAGYTAYRAKMTPLLVQHGGSFGVDVRVAEVLRSPSDEPFNRLFTIRFPAIEDLEAFFAHPEYLEIRRELFETSVAATTFFGRYRVL